MRYTGVSIAFNAGGVIGGGFAPNLAQLVATNGGVAQVGLLLTAAGVLSLAGVLLARPLNR